MPHTVTRCGRGWIACAHMGAQEVCLGCVWYWNWFFFSIPIYNLSPSTPVNAQAILEYSIAVRVSSHQAYLPPEWREWWPDLVIHRSLVNNNKKLNQTACISLTQKPFPAVAHLTANCILPEEIRRTRSSRECPKWRMKVPRELGKYHSGRLRSKSRKDYAFITDIN